MTVTGLSVRGTVIPDDELRWRFSRSGGPGGQSVNTTDSRVELSYDVAGGSLPRHLRERAVERLGSRLVDGVLTIAASEYRSQHRNREAGTRPAGRGPRRRHRSPAAASATDQAVALVAGAPARGQEASG